MRIPYIGAHSFTEDPEYQRLRKEGWRPSFSFLTDEDENGIRYFRVQMERDWRLLGDYHSEDEPPGERRPGTKKPGAEEPGAEEPGAEGSAEGEPGDA